MTIRFSPKKELAARLIAGGRTQAATYRDERIDVTKQTMSNWNQEEEFIARVAELKIDVVSNVQEILIKSAPEAAEALVDLVTSSGFDKMGIDDIKMATLKLKGSLWILERVLGKEQLRAKSIVGIKDDLDDEEEEDFTPDPELIENVLNAVK